MRSKYLIAQNKTTADLLTQFFTRERELLPASKAAIYWDEIVSTDLHTNLNPQDVVQFWHDSSTGLLQQYLADTPATNTAIISACKYTSNHSWTNQALEWLGSIKPECPLQN